MRRLDQKRSKFEYFAKNTVRNFWRKNDTKVFESKIDIKNVSAQKRNLVDRLFSRDEVLVLVSF